MNHFRAVNGGDKYDRGAFVQLLFLKKSLDHHHRPRKVDSENSVYLIRADKCERVHIRNTGAAGDAVKDEIVDRLKLGNKAKPFDELPQSFLIMLDCDHAYLQSESSTPLDDQFGSVAIALLYREVTAACGATSPIPDMMLSAIAGKTGQQPIIG